MVPRVTIQSQLMKNFVAGKVLPAQRHLALARDAAGSPILFSVDDSHFFAVSIRSDETTSGWTQVDLGAQLQSITGAALTVQTFAAAQGPDGSIWIAAAAKGTGDSGSRLFVSKSFAENSTLDDWKAFGSKLIERPLPAAIDIMHLSLGIGVGAYPTPLLVFAGTGQSGKMLHYQVNPDPADKNWTVEQLVFPQNTTKCLAATPGYLSAQGLGVYALCEVGILKSLTFTPLPQYFNGHPVIKPAIDLGLPEKADLQAISAVPLDDAQTELYVGGAGLWRYDLAAQATSNRPGAVIEDGTYFDAVTALRVRRNPQNTTVGVWGTVKGDVLMFTRGDPTSTQAGAWQPPLPLEVEVTAMDAVIAADGPDGSSITCAMGFSDGSLALSVQDPGTELWRRQQVSVQSLKDVVEMETYTTRIVVRDEKGAPAQNADVLLEPSFDCVAGVNGRYRVLMTGTPKTVTTNGAGILTIVLQTAALEAPVYTVTAAGQTQTANPMDDVRNQMAKYTTGSEIENARKSNGQPLFPNGVAKEKADSAAASLDTLVKVYDDMPADGTRHPQADQARRAVLEGSAKRRVLLAVSSDPARVIALSPDAGQAKFDALGSSPLMVNAGDLFSALDSGIEAAGHFFVTTFEGAYEFVVDLGERVLSFIFEIGSQVFTAVNWVMKQLLGFDLNDLVAWLGFIFDWEAVLQTHTVIRQMVDLNFDYMVRNIPTVKKLLDEALIKVRELIKVDGITVDTSNGIFAKRLDTNYADPPPKDDDPQTSWGNDHFNSGASDVSATGVDIVTNIEDILSNLVETEGAVLRNALNQVSTDIFDQIDQLDWAQTIERLLSVIAEGLVNSAENVALTFLEIAGQVLAAFRKILDARWEIPVITYVYEEIICQGDGSKLTMLDLASLLVAIPASVAYRAATGEAIFPEATVKKIENAKTFEEIITALNAMPKSAVLPQASLPAGRDILPAATSDQRSPGERALIAMQWLATFSRTGSWFGTIINDSAAEINELEAYALRHIKSFTAGCDIMTSTFATVGTLIVGINDKWKQSAYVTIDNALTWSSWLWRVRDISLLIYLYRKETEAPEAIRKGISTIEGFFGFGSAIAVAVSAVEQAKQGPPAFLTTEAEKAAWERALAFKVIQNESSSLYQLLAPVKVFAAPPLKWEVTVARMWLSAFVLFASVIRASTESMYIFSDLDF